MLESQMGASISRWPRVATRLKALASCLLLCVSTACRNVLDVAPPAGIVTAEQLKSRSGAENIFANAKANFFGEYAGLYGIVNASDLFSDEFQCSDATYGCFFSGFPYVDARQTVPSNALLRQILVPNIMSFRSTLLIAHSGLAAYEPEAGQHLAGEALTLVGFDETFLAELFCSGATLDELLPNGGWKYTQPFTTDSILGFAEAHFDSALVYAHGDITVTALANLGLARVRLDRGNFTGAATAAANVPTGFVYNAVMSPTSGNGGTNLYNAMYSYYYGAFMNVSDHEGGNGLNYVSAHDPRLAFDSSKTTGYGTTFYFPTKFASNTVPLATGIEARLIEAEVALHAGQTSAWLADLNALRTTCTSAATCTIPAPAGTGGVAGLTPLDDPGNTSARIALMFRERAFWLFGTAHRVGDMRRLLKQYGTAGFTAASVYPAGTYTGAGTSGPPSYGTDISIALPSPTDLGATNPAYRGCTGSSTTD